MVIVKSRYSAVDEKNMAAYYMLSTPYTTTVRPVLWYDEI